MSSTTFVPAADSTVVNPPSFLPPRRRSTSVPDLSKKRRSTPSISKSPPPFLPPRRPTVNTRVHPAFRNQYVDVTSTHTDSASTEANIHHADSTTSSPLASTHPSPSPPTTNRQVSLTRPVSPQSFSSGDSLCFPDTILHRTPSSHSLQHAATSTTLHHTTSTTSLRNQLSNTRNDTPTPTRSPSLEPIHDNILLTTLPRPTHTDSSAAMCHSSLRIMSRLSDDESNTPMLPLPPPALSNSHSETHLRSPRDRPLIHPTSASESRTTLPLTLRDLEILAANQGEEQYDSPASSRPHTPDSAYGTRPKRSLTRLSSLDNFIAYREEKAEWKRSCSLRRGPVGSQAEERAKALRRLNEGGEVEMNNGKLTYSTRSSLRNSIFNVHEEEQQALPPFQPSSPPKKTNKFRHWTSELLFCFTIAMTQFLAEYLISGFAIALPRLLKTTATSSSSAMGIFWPASLLSLILSATLFIFARLSDMHSGYPCFMFGVAWLALWTLIPGFTHTTILLDISRAMQGLAIAAFTPSTFAMVGSIYPEGPRRNFIMGLYSGCAPLGFFAGFVTAGTLPEEKPQSYFLIAAALAGTTLVTAFLSVPSDREERAAFGLKMDWVGSGLIMSGLILVSYALAVEPYANEQETAVTGFAFPIVIGPCASGIVCLLVAFWYEGWCATCPLVPFDFFKPKSVKAFSLACLCFYASYGVWLYNSAQYFQSPTGTIADGGILSGKTLALWYLPTAIGGILLCVVGGSLMHLVPIMALLLLSALAWIAAPLLLALAPLPLNYWSFVMPSMICATIGIDLTFTVSIVFFSSVQPIHYQGLSGAVASSLVNLAMSFALSISEIVMKQASSVEMETEGASINWGFQSTFFYATASAGAGLVLCVLFVRISRSVVSQQEGDEETRVGSRSSHSTLVGEREVDEEGRDV